MLGFCSLRQVYLKTTFLGTLAYCLCVCAQFSALALVVSNFSAESCCAARLCRLFNRHVDHTTLKKETDVDLTTLKKETDVDLTTLKKGVYKDTLKA